MKLSILEKAKDLLTFNERFGGFMVYTFMVLYETFDFYKSFTSFLENLEQQFQ